MIRNIFLIIAGMLCAISNAQQVTGTEYINNALDAYNGNSMNAGSARYIGMGGSMGALGDDPSSVGQNPAGIGVAVSSQLSFTPNIVSNELRTSFGNRTENDNLTRFQFNNVNAVLVIPTNDNNWKNVNLGFNISTENLDRIEAAIPENLIPLYYYDDFTDPTNAVYRDLDSHINEVDGFKSKFSISTGANYKDFLYLGLNLNMHSVNIDQYKTTTDYNYDENGDFYGSYAYDQDGTPFQELAAGFSLGVGVIAKVHRNVRLGAAYHSPTWYHDIEQEWFGYNNNQYGLNLGLYHLTTPGKFVGSAGFVIGKIGALNFDYTRHFNQNTNLRPNNSFVSVNNFIDGQVENSNEYRVGGEVRLGDFRLRAGYGFAGSPFKDLKVGDYVNNDRVFAETPRAGFYDNGTGISIGNATVKNTFIGDRNTFSAGLGYDFGVFFADFAWQQMRQDYTNFFGNGAYNDVNDPSIGFELANTYVYEVEQRRNNFFLTLGWRF